jgi:hypothetical protein
MLRLGWVILLCVSVDFSNPMLPGSVRFDPSESIEAVHGGTVAPNTGPQSMWRTPTPPPRIPAAALDDAVRIPPRVNVERRRFLAVRPVHHQREELTTAFPAEDH